MQDHLRILQISVLRRTDLNQLRASFMRTAIFIALLTAFVVSQAEAVVLPPAGLSPGDKYQLLFVTIGTINALSSNIDDYNAFVNAEAALSPTLPSGVTWRAVASTHNVAARDNAPAGLYPVFTTNGARVTPGTDLYGELHDPTVGIWSQYGDGPSGVPWSGSNNDGTAATAFPIGFDGEVFDVTLGGPGWGDGGLLLGDNQHQSWLVAGITSNFSEHTIYALSSPITFVPEPDAFVLYILGILGVGLFGWRRCARSAVPA